MIIIIKNQIIGLVELFQLKLFDLEGNDFYFLWKFEFIISK